MHIQKLPVELLSEILTLVVQDSTPEDELYAHPQGALAPIALSTVNRHWRQIALRTPRIWTHICVEGRAVQPIETFLRLSQNQSIDIVIDAKDDAWQEAVWSREGEDDLDDPDCTSIEHPFTSAKMTTIMAKLLPHLHRCRSFQLYADTYGPLHSALVALNTPSSIPNNSLECLRLVRCNEYAGRLPMFQPCSMLESGQTPFGAFGPTLPKTLQELSLSGVHVDWNALAKRLPYTLQSLSLQHLAENVRPSIPELIQISKSVPALAELSMIGSGPYFGESVPDIGSIRLPVLSELQLGFLDTSIAYHVLMAFDAPRLVELTLEDECLHSGSCDMADDASSLLFLCRTMSDGRPKFPALESVRLENIHFTDGKAANTTLLKVFPDLFESEDGAKVYTIGPSGKE